MKKRLTSTQVAWLCVGIGVVAVAVAWQARPRRRGPVRDYSDRSGLPRAVDDMRGAARADFDVPSDMDTPTLLRPLSAP